MTKVYTSAVVLIPPENLWAPIQVIREKYDRNYHRWMPHITLLYPFRPEVEFDLLELDFKKICENVKPFKVKLENFYFFHHKKERYTMWLKPTPQKFIIELQKQVQQAAPDCNNVSLFKGGFTPHLSVGQITGKELLHETLFKIKSQWNPLQYLVDRIYFIAREQNKKAKFQIKKIFELKNNTIK